MKSEKLKAVVVFLVVMSVFYFSLEVISNVLAGADFNLISVLRRVLVFDLCMAIFSLSLEYKYLFMLVSTFGLSLAVATFVHSLFTTEVNAANYRLLSIVYTVVTVVYIVPVAVLRWCGISMIDDTLKSLQKLKRK